MNQFSLNNRLIVEAYKTDGTIKANVQSGFATIAQKVQLKGLRLLVDAFVTVNSSEPMHVPAGSKVYIREEYLYTQPWAKKVFECDTLSEKFIVVEAAHVEFISPPETPAA
jgi:hypothetical protein